MSGRRRREEGGRDKEVNITARGNERLVIDQNGRVREGGREGEM